MAQDSPSKASKNILRLSFVLGIAFSVSMFYTDSSALRNFLGLLTGMCFSPFFTSDRSDSYRYFGFAFILCILAIMALGLPRLPLAIIILILAVSVGVDAKTKAYSEAREKYEEKEQVTACF